MLIHSERLMEFNLSFSKVVHKSIILLYFIFNSSTL